MAIIGAGLAGLAAALELHRAGWRTTVLEARWPPRSPRSVVCERKRGGWRVGGRVPQAVRDGFHHSQYAEGGGEFIEARHDRLLNLASEFGLTLEVLVACRLSFATN